MSNVTVFDTSLLYVIVSDLPGRGGNMLPLPKSILILSPSFSNAIIGIINSPVSPVFTFFMLFLKKSFAEISVPVDFESNI